MEPLKEIGKTVLTLENCIIPNERLLNTPSSKDGMSRDTEIDIRIKGCECIQSAGLLLKLPQAAMATAQIIYQRFFYAKSMVKFNFYYAAMASLFLAAKIEECNRRLRDVLNVFHHLKQKRKSSKMVPMDYVGEEYYRMRNTVNKYERYILKELGFCVHVQHPHKLVITCLQLLELEKNNHLVQRAWNLMNDSLRTNIFVRYEVETIACACVFLASRQLKILLPESPSWWRLFDVRFKDMKAISLELLALYNREHKTLDNLEKEVESLKEYLMTQKKVEIKEIHVKRIEQMEDSSPSQSVSPNHPSPLANNNSTTKSSSPLTKPVQNPLVDVTYKSIQKKDGRRSPVNGYKRERDDDGLPVIEKKQKLMSNQSVKRQRTPEAYRPILSPIKLSSDSHSEESLSPSSQPPNGHPNHYSNDDDITETSRSRKHHRHKHRSSSSKHRRHRRERSRERSDERKHSRHHHREDKALSRHLSLPTTRDFGRVRKPDLYYR